MIVYWSLHEFKLNIDQFETIRLERALSFNSFRVGGGEYVGTRFSYTKLLIGNQA